MPSAAWGPMAEREKIPSLLDDAGRLFAPSPARRAALLGQARLDEVEIEFRAQIDAVADAGLTPTHLDFHCLADGGRDDILGRTVRLATEYGLMRRTDYEFLTSPRARELLRQEGIVVLDYRTIQQVWSRLAGPR